MPPDPLTPEQAARLIIDANLTAARWILQDPDEINLGASLGVAVREFPTDVGPCDDLLFVAGKPAGMVEAEQEGVVLTGIEAQTRDYAGKLPVWTNPPLRPLPFLTAGTWPAQIGAVENLEASIRQGRPRALVQIATGSGKTHTAIAALYRLVKFSGARRALFLVDRGNLGRQAHKEFQAYTT